MTMPLDTFTVNRMRISAVLLLSAVTLASAPAVAQVETQAGSGAAAEASTPFERARALAAAGRHDEAIGLYNDLLERDPANADARLARGRTYAWMKQWDRAEADLLAVTTASPGYADAWSALGDIYLWQGKDAEAVAAYSKWQSLQPDRHAPLLARSRAHAAAGNREAARADLDAAVALGAEVPAPAAGRRGSTPEASAPRGFDWALQADVSHTDFSGARASWNDRALSLRRYLDRASVAVEVLETQRFGRDDHAIAIDAYVDAWARAYANLRYQHAPDATLFPGNAWRAELFQGVGRGWELSASIDQLRFRSTTVDIYGLGVGHYVGRFYVRARSRYSTSSENFSHSAQVRYYYSSDASEYFELSAGSGRREDERFGVSVDEDSRSVGLAYVRYPTRNLGFKLAAGYADDTVDETRAAATVYYRW